MERTGVTEGWNVQSERENGGGELRRKKGEKGLREREKMKKKSALRNRGSERDRVTKRGSVPRDPRETEECRWKRWFKERVSLQLDTWNPKPS